MARGRALAAWGRGRCGGTVEEELRRLREEAERAGWNTALPALEQALSGGPAGADGSCVS